MANPAAALATVASLLRQTQLSFEELEVVGGTRFVGGLAIAGRESCDTSKMRVTNLRVRLDALHRFVRLQRWLGWETDLLDDAITAAGGALSEAGLRQLADLVRTSHDLGWTVEGAIEYLSAADREERVASALHVAPPEVALLAQMLEVDLEAGGSAAAREVHDTHARLARSGVAVWDAAYVILGELDDTSPSEAGLERIADTIARGLGDARATEQGAMLAQLLASSLGLEPSSWEPLLAARPAVLAALELGGSDAMDWLRRLSRVERARRTLAATDSTLVDVLDGSASFAALIPELPDDLASRAGVDEATLRRWAERPSQALADELEGLVRDRAGEAWSTVGKKLRDPIRERQAHALSAYLLGSGRPPGAEWSSTSDLYAHFLVDPEMSACATTSRIKLAHLSVQLLVQRIRMNLEEGLRADAEVDPDWRQWDWRRSYRVWEAGRRVFLYPENLLAPELRTGKTPLFEALESTLLENDVTNARAQEALVEYLEGLARIAHLEVVGFTVEERVDREVMHVFGRTRNDPETYWYRRQERTPHGAQWSPWEKVNVAIDEGDSLLPVIWNGQLYLFWPQLADRSEAPPKPTLPKTDEPFDAGRTYSEMRLAWSRYRDGQWSSKVMSAAAGPLPAASAIRVRLTERHWTGAAAGLSILGSVEPRAGSAVAVGGPNPPVWEVAFAFDHPSARPRVFHEGSSRSFPSAASWRSIGTAVEATDGALRLEPSERRVALRSRSTLRLVPPSQKAFERPHELFVEDATRSLFIDWDASEELLALLRDAVRSGNVLATIVLGLATLGSVRYTAQLFHLPFVQRLLASLHGSGVGGLFQRSLQLSPWAPSESPAPLEDTYALNPALFGEPYPADDFDFSATGAHATYLWELFVHVPLFIAEHLRQNQRFEEARRWLHFVFDPTDDSDLPSPERYWVARPLHEAALGMSDGARIETLLDPARRADDQLLHQVESWADDPFDAHRVARLRPLAYMKHVFMRYLDLLIEEADHLFRRATDWEDLNEATQLYVRAADLLGPRPQRLPARERGEAQSYLQLRERLDEFGNAAIMRAEERIGPIRLTKGGLLASTTPAIERARVPRLRFSFTPYFCFPSNAELLGYWDTVADRLFKLRHCQNIEGGVLDLPLFEPPIDPSVLARARELGVDVRDALRDASTPPAYRFEAQLAMAQRLTQQVRSFGGALQSALERRDAEELSLLRSSQEVELLERVRTDRERQLEVARQERAAAARSIQLTTQRRDYYASRDYMNAGEAAQLALLTQVMVTEHAAGALDLVGNILQLIPDFKVGSPFSMGATFGGSNLGPALRAFAAFTRSQGSVMGTQARMSAILAGHQRRMDEWTLQRELADTELEQLAHRAAAAELREAITQSELDAHERRIEHAARTHELLQDKFTNRDLYSWMASQLGAAYFAAYQLAHQAARRAERAFEYELGGAPSFVRAGSWDSLREGLLAGEQIALDLSRLEVAYREQNTRRFELTKNVSLRDIDPMALLRLRQEGSCFFEVPEALLDRDFPSHVERRIQSVSLTLPCVTGPLTGVPCTLSLVSSRVRWETGGALEPVAVGTTSVALSSGLNDAGLFDPRPGDPRYLPFEGAGAVSQWRLELPQARPFDYDTITDAVLHIRYTARDGGTSRPVTAPSPTDLEARQVLFSARRGIPEAWARFVNDGAPLEVELGPERFPFRLREASIDRVEILAASSASDPLEVTVETPSGATHAGSLSTHPDVSGVAHIGFDVTPHPLSRDERTWTVSLTRGDPSALDDLYVLVLYSV